MEERDEGAGEGSFSGENRWASEGVHHRHFAGELGPKVCNDEGCNRLISGDRLKGIDL